MEWIWICERLWSFELTKSAAEWNKLQFSSRFKVNSAATKSKILGISFVLRIPKTVTTLSSAISASKNLNFHLFSWMVQLSFIYFISSNWKFYKLQRKCVQIFFCLNSFTSCFLILCFLAISRSFNIPSRFSRVTKWNLNIKMTRKKFPFLLAWFFCVWNLKNLPWSSPSSRVYLSQFCAFPIYFLFLNF